MSLKDLFGKRSNQVLTSADLEKLEKDIESHEYAEEKIKDSSRFVPRSTINFEDPSTFARYGSAKKYYEDAVTSILKTYPYDGSLKEKLEWHNSATYIDNWIFENKYPRTTGHVTFNGGKTAVSSGVDGDSWTHTQTTNAQYIDIRGGLNVDPNADGNNVSEIWSSNSNIYDADKSRSTNFYVDGDSGNTIEFWWKENDTTINAQCLFDLWNSISPGAEGYGRILIEHKGSGWTNIFRVTYQVDVDNYDKGVDNVDIGSASDISKKIDGFDITKWNHYAITFINASTDDISIKLYINGQYITEAIEGTKIENDAATGGTTMIPNTLKARIGAYQTQPNIAIDDWGEQGFEDDNAGALRGSIDEFRFWKKARTTEEIGRYWFTQVGGGTNTDDSNVELGVYYKFNEGITKLRSIDPNVLDYSGRISNGTIINYSSGVRSTVSAIEEYSSSDDLKEFKDPIIYQAHPEIEELLEDVKLEGDYHDGQNSSLIYNTLPQWIREGDEEGEREELSNLTQVIASYFDTLHLQIEALPSLKNIEYTQDGTKPLPFAKHLLESVGFVAPEILVDATVMESLAGRNEDSVFEEDIGNVKNLIYQNIYNNIAGIYKSKGTEKAFRNLLHCFGIGDQLIKVNLYGDNVTYKLEDNVKSISARKNYIDFNHPDRFSSTIYQENTITGATGSKLDYIPFTLEAEVLFPKKLSIDHPNYFSTPFKEVSLFGMHETDGDLTILNPDSCGFKVLAIKESINSNNAKFKLVASDTGVKMPNEADDPVVAIIETATFKDVYDNERWNFAVRIRVDEAPLSDGITGASDTKYHLDFYGANMMLDIVQESFLESVEIKAGATAAMNAAKRIYVGADRAGFTGATVNNKTDVKIGSVRYWQDYLDDDTIKNHAKDVTNYGRQNPLKPAHFNQTSIAATGATAGFYVPEIDTLALHWDFETTGVGVTGPQFSVDDVSFTPNVTGITGAPDITFTDRYGFLGGILKTEHKGKAFGFLANDKGAIDKDYVFTAKQQLPEILNSSDTINILSQDYETFTRDARPIDYFWAIEKSMYQTISDEIINIFSSIAAFNNLIGEPVNRYRGEYKDLQKLRQLFFERIKDEPSIEKYIEFYKWLDSSMNVMLQELIPASANFSDEMRTMVESHVLERNKYQTKFPTLDTVRNDGRRGGEITYEGVASGISQLRNDWRTFYSTAQEGLISCLPTQVPDSNYAATGSIAGNVGDTIIVNCTGTGALGGGVFTCGKGGVWIASDGADLVCTMPRCSPTEDPNSIDYTATGSIGPTATAGQTFATPCATGYTGGLWECTSGATGPQFTPDNWSGGCTGITCRTNPSNSSSVLIGGYRETGTVTCSDGYLAGGTSTTEWVCGDTAQFTGTECAPVDCEDWNVYNSNYAPGASSLAGNYDTAGPGGSNSITVTCVPGYTGGGPWTCGSDGHFTGAECTRKICTPTEVLNSDYEVTGSVTGAYEEQVKITCNDGFGPLHFDDTTYSTLYCKADGVFSIGKRTNSGQLSYLPTNVDCKQCPEGEYSSNGNPCKQCPDGYYSDAPGAAACTPWSPAPTGYYIFAAGSATGDNVIQPNNCTGCVDGDGSTGADCAVHEGKDCASCKDGFDHIGKRCISKTCNKKDLTSPFKAKSLPETDYNAASGYLDQGSGEEVTCEDGYHINNDATAYWKCTYDSASEDVSWTGDECTKSWCSEYTDANGFTNINSKILGSTGSYSCDTGYEGGTGWKCTAVSGSTSAEWTGGTECTPKECTATEVPNSDRSYDDSITGKYTDAEITVTCDDGYTNTGIFGGATSGTWECNASGEWDINGLAGPSYCQIMSCESDFPVANSSDTLSGEFSQTKTVNCNAGYKGSGVWSCKFDNENETGNVEWKEENIKSHCTPCPAGTYSAAGATACEECPAGKWTGATGSSACTPWTEAATGHYVVDGSRTKTTDSEIKPNKCDCDNGVGIEGEGCDENGGDECASCDLGYNLDPATKKCIIQSCPDTQAVHSKNHTTNGSITGKYNDPAFRIECNTGYSSNGSPQNGDDNKYIDYTCNAGSGATGVWSTTGDDPTGCKIIECTDREVPNSDHAATNSLSGSYDNSIDVACVTGFSGGGEWTCGSNGTWSGTECEDDPCVTWTVNNATINGSTATLSGDTDDTKVVLCDTGYKLKNAPEDFPPEITLECQASNDWAWINDTSDPKTSIPKYTDICVPKACNEKTVPNSDKSITPLTGNTTDKVSVTCVDGYEGGGDWTCGSDGKFTGASCDSTYCPETQPDNVVEDAATEYLGQKATFTCKAGYEGGGTYTCGASKTWNTDSFTECTACNVGEYSSDSGDCKRCPDKTWTGSTGSSECTSWTKPDDGEYTFAAGSATGDNDNRLKECNCTHGIGSTGADCAVHAGEGCVVGSCHVGYINDDTEGENNNCIAAYCEPFTPPNADRLTRLRYSSGKPFGCNTGYGWYKAYDSTWHVGGWASCVAVDNPSPTDPVVEWSNEAKVGCSPKPCNPTEIPHSVNHSVAGSITGAFGHEVNVECEAGYYGGGTWACQGKENTVDTAPFGDFSGTPCTICPAGTYSAAGATACTPVGPNQWAAEGATGPSNHSPCASGYYESEVPSSISDRRCARNECVCPNGTPVTSSNCATHGATACQSCDVGGGYYLNGSNNHCEKIQATAAHVPHTTIGTMNLPSSIFGATATVDCVAGYTGGGTWEVKRKAGTNGTELLEGEWTGTECTPKTCTPKKIENILGGHDTNGTGGQLQWLGGSFYAHGDFNDQVVTHCKDGYEGGGTWTCNGDDFVLTSGDECTPKSCGQKTINNSVEGTINLSHRESKRVYCNDGYSDEVLLWRDYSYWRCYYDSDIGDVAYSGDECAPSSCSSKYDHIPGLPPGAVAGEALTPAVLGSTGSYSCATGYEGGTGWECTAVASSPNASWTGGTNCTPIECNPKTVANSDYSLTGMTGSYGATATVTCATGYLGALVGTPSTSIWTCGSNKEFTGTECRPHSCNPKNVPFSNYSSTLLTGVYGATATVSCSLGYEGGGEWECGAAQNFTGTGCTRIHFVAENCSDKTALLLHFDVDSDSKPVDSSINQINAEYIGPVPPVLVDTHYPIHFSDFPNSVYFSGDAGSYIDIDYPRYLGLTGAFTIDFWIMWPDQAAISDHSVIFGRGSDLSSDRFPALKLTLHANGELNLRHDYLGDKNQWTVSSFASSLTPLQWHHIAITRNDQNALKIYLDGVTLGAGGNLWTPTKALDWGATNFEYEYGGDDFTNHTTGKLRLGNWNEADTNPNNFAFKGYMKEFRITSKVLWEAPFNSTLSTSAEHCLGVKDQEVPYEFPSCYPTPISASSNLSPAILFHFNGDSAERPIDSGPHNVDAFYKGETYLVNDKPEHFVDQPSSSLFLTGNHLTAGATGTDAHTMDVPILHIKYPAEETLYDAFTMDFWIKFPDQNSINRTWPTELTLDTSKFDPTWYNRRILSAQNSDSTYFRIMQKTNKTIEISVPTIIATFSIDTYLSAGSWHHFAIIRLPKQSPGNVPPSSLWKVIIDGAVIASETTSDTNSMSPKDFGGLINIGAEWPYPPKYATDKLIHIAGRYAARFYMKEFRIINGEAIDFSTAYTFADDSNKPLPCESDSICGYNDVVVLHFSPEETEKPIDSTPINTNCYYTGSTGSREIVADAPAHFSSPPSSLSFVNSYSTPTATRDILAVELEPNMFKEAFTIDFWIKFKNLTSYRTAYLTTPAKGTQDSWSHSFWILQKTGIVSNTSKTASINFQIFTPRGGWTSATTTIELYGHGISGNNETGWYHIALVRNEDDTSYFYFNEEATTAPSRVSMGAYLKITSALYPLMIIGAFTKAAYSSPFGFTGYIDEFRIRRGAVNFLTSWPPNESCNGGDDE